MFIGALGHGNPVRRMLMPVRTELSLLGCIAILGHVGVYALSYLTLFGRFGHLRLLIEVALVVALVLVVLLIPLAVTSVPAVKRAMNGVLWKRVQRLAYVFFGVLFVHMGVYLAAPTLAGSARAIAGLAVYAAILVAYVVLRCRRAAKDAL